MRVLLFGIALACCWAAHLAQSNNRIDQDGTADLDKFYLEWDAPEDLKRDFTYYLAGNDDEGRPLWILEFGKWDFRKLIEQGSTKVKELDTYADQFFWRVQRSIQTSINPEDGEPPTGWVCIFDMENYNAWQLASPQTVLYVLNLARKFEIAARNMDYGFLINMNYIAERLIGILRPVLGTTLDRAEISGTNRERWVPSILKRVPKHIIPEWYGGYKNFTPVAVYG